MNVHSVFDMTKRNHKKELIIDAAIQVFAEKGFYLAKVADVARQAGVADGTIYLYFKNKDDILISLFETKMEAILNRFRNIADSDESALIKIRRFIQLHFRLIEEDQKLAEVFKVELRQSAKFLKDYHNQKFIDFLSMIGDILHDGQKNGVFRPDFRINIMKLAIFGALDEIARQWILQEEPKFHLQEAALDLAETVIKGLVP
jgi:TetR/AcrR family fatty acid metabolism transcriptional regulator